MSIIATNVRVSCISVITLDDGVHWYAGENHYMRRYLLWVRSINTKRDCTEKVSDMIVTHKPSQVNCPYTDNVLTHVHQTIVKSSGES